jgi:hypothetical protein
MTYFLLVYSRSKGELVGQPLSYPSHAEALRARFRREAHTTDPDIEIVVLGGESIESLMQTHSRYFGGARSLAASQ